MATRFEQPVSATKLDVIVVGAGLSGLAAAISTRLSGHNVTVFESARELQEVGAGLQLTPNCTLILQQWGLPDRFWATAAEPTELLVHRYSGEILAIEHDFNKNIRAKYGAPFLDSHRVDLQLALYDRARELGVHFNLGERVSTIDFDIPELVTMSGRSARGDLIIAADGLWSRSRALFTGTDEAPRPTGDLAYRVMLDLDQVNDPELRQWIQNPTVHFWIGPGAHAVGYSLRGGNMYNIVLLVPDDLPAGVSRQPGSVEEMRALFTGWDPVLTRLLDMIDSVEKWKLMHREELPTWINEKANFVFVGDACHPMLPYLAQGANSAVEDGAVLGLLLGHINSKHELSKALGMYQQLRKTRGDAIVRETFKQREAFHMRCGPAQEARDQVFLSQLHKPLKGPFPSRWTCPEVQPWLYGYNAFQEVQTAIQISPFRPTEPLRGGIPSTNEATNVKTPTVGVRCLVSESARIVPTLIGARI
ncbi:3-hydroxybenzoate 6-hydroxylase [Cyphellophora attinorum]|uniref:3-hydroxybenzoate 6-hydroxylase n=1 Tax=Cyphellophora attinorum TaxID=1664694 RepID=A0A0N0NLI5_9EURO|nr:3-hydroxybenzoate 6-hydroxylase [Phialophora attinorum]KPI39218.1 3-hydroxybenzoate 6-hydroxylase [Phialophora attinorum]